MKEVSIIGVDLAKQVFQLHGATVVSHPRRHLVCQAERRLTAGLACECPLGIPDDKITRVDDLLLRWNVVQRFGQMGR